LAGRALDEGGGGAGVGGDVVVVVGGGVVVVVVVEGGVVVVVGGTVVVVVETGDRVVGVCANVEVVLVGTEDAPALVPAPSIMTRQRDSKRTALANRTMPSLTVQRPLPTSPPPTPFPSLGRAGATTTNFGTMWAGVDLIGK
jgi:hypothetical protein